MFQLARDAFRTSPLPLKMRSVEIFPEHRHSLRYPTSPKLHTPRYAMSIRAQVAPIQHVKKVWERIAPLHLADKSWDNVG